MLLTLAEDGVKDSRFMGAYSLGGVILEVGSLSDPSCDGGNRSHAAVVLSIVCCCCSGQSGEDKLERDCKKRRWFGEVIMP